jgi:hypothetical protein
MSPINPPESEITRCRSAAGRARARRVPAQGGDVAERDRADDEVDGVVRERHVVQVRLVRLAIGHLLASPLEHPGRGVDADHLVTQRGQVGGVAAGTAGRVESDADRKRVENLVHDRLLDLEEHVPGLVVERRPPVVALTRRDRTNLDAVAQVLGRIQERLDLAEASQREVPVVHARECPEQRDPFQAEEIRQRVLVDHGSFHEPFRMPT